MRTNINHTSNASIGVIFQLADGRIQACNHAAEMILGYSAKQIVEADYFAPPWQTIHEDGSPFPPETHPAIASLITGQFHFDVVMGFYQPNGKLVWLSVDTQPLFSNSSSQPYAVSVSFKTISTPSSVSAANQVTVLLIEDNAIDREMYRRYLKGESEYQYNFVEADTGEEAFRLYLQCQPDVVLLDYLLPDMDGLEWLTRWQQTPTNRSAVIVLTGQGNESIAVQSIKLGAVDYLVKGQLTREKLRLEVKKAIAQERFRLQHQATLDDLQQNQQFTAQITDAIPGVIYIYDVISQQNLYINSQVYNLLGYTPQQIAALGENSIQQLMHPDDLALFAIHVAKLEQARADQVYKIEYRMRHQNGEWRWFSSQDRVYKRTNDGSLEQILGIARDITSHRQIEINLRNSEERLNLATVASGIGMWFWDLVGNILEFTPQCKTLFGLDPEAKISYEIFLNLVHPEDRDRTDLAIQQALTNKTDYSYEYRVILPDGTTHWLAAQGRGFYNQAGEPVRMMGVVQDITQRKESEQKLHENEQLLRLALANAKAGLWSWEVGSQKVIWSSETYELYGIPPQPDIQYQDWEGTVHPDDLESVNQTVQEVLSGQSSELQTEFRIIHPQKGILWLLSIGNVTRNANGEPIRFSGINIDISDRKMNEEALRHSEQHLRRVLDSLFSFVGVMTPDGILIEVNRTALKAANLQPEDVIGKSFAETYWWSYDAKIQAQLNQSIQRAAQGETIHYDVIIRLSDQKCILIDFALVPLFDDEGKVEYLIPSGIDVSDREASKQALRESEYQLILITEIIPQHIWTAAPDGEIDYLNQRWQDYTGITLEQLNQQGFAVIIHPDDFPRVTQAWNESIQLGKKFDLETRLRQADGTYRWFLGRARPLRNEQGKIIKWYGTNTDITLIKELEEKLRQQTEDLIKANQLKDEFLAIVSHELRTPLNPILGWSQLIGGGKLDPNKIATGIETIQRNAKLQAQLIDDLLDVSRILRGTLSLQLTPINLESVIRMSLNTVQLAAESKSLEIKTIFEPDIGEVLGDTGRLQQIVWNLLSNAIKFTPNGGKITVILERVDIYAQIQIQDTGRGIDPEFLPHVFERFRQAESSSTRQFGGLGLGLAIVRHLVELHGGTVTATSPGQSQGATFKIKLPLMNTPNKSLRNQVIDESILPNRFEGIQILVIDDEIDSRDILTFVLKQESAEVIPVASAEEALTVLKELTPDLIISDIGMPEVDGYTLMLQIRSLPQNKNIPAIALTAYAGEMDQQRALDAGFQRHISKPVNISELINTITQLLSKSF